jgi:serine/threonine protein kinase
VSIGTGTRLGQYEVQDFIGQGAMGVVYRAYHAQLARTGAVKVMQGISPDVDSIARFRREAQAIAQMRHPNILNVFDFGEFEGTPYMIVEYVPGGSLASRMRHGPMDHSTIIETLSGIANGLDYAHSLGIVHRDVKPANVLLEKDGTPVIADFGLVKLLQSASVSMSGVTTGTPAYMSPEQVTGSPVGPAADRYSLATIAYEMLTGAIPFDGEGVLEVLYAHVHRDPPPPSLRRPDLGRRVDAVVLRGLAKDPTQRWESCEAFVTALRQALAGTAAPTVERTVVMAPPLEATRPTSYQAAPAPPAAPVPIATTHRSHRTRNAILAVVGVLLLLTVLLLGVAASRTPTLALSSNPVQAGDHVVVSATRLPANQDGEIQLLSPVKVVPFKADGSGNMSVDVVVPRDIGTGDHIVRICWNSTCHTQVTLHVTAPAALVTPSPSSSPSRTPSPTSGASPSPSATARSLALSSNHIVVHTGKMTVKGFHFTPGQALTLTFIQASSNTSRVVATATVGTDATFLQTYTVPSSATVGSAYIRACDAGGCAFASFSVTATG